MRSRLLTTALIIALVNLSLGCTRSEERSIVRQDLSQNASQKILWATLQDGNTVVFDADGGTYVQAAGGTAPRYVVAGTTSSGEHVQIPQEQLLEVRLQIERADAIGTSLIVLTIPAVITTAFIAAFLYSLGGHCPFVYSYDGRQYTFDAQCYSGALTRGLKRADYSRLDHLKPVDGAYRLMMRNDMRNETQYTDELKLLVIDHAPGTTVTPGEDGTMHVLNGTAAPISAVDENGRDLMRFLGGRDEIRWQTVMPADTSYRGADARHHLTLTFARPRGARTARLYANVGTAFWGTRMIERFLRLHGTGIDAWYAGVDRGGAELKEVRSLTEDEELYRMKVKLREGSAWTVRGTLGSGGSIDEEDRVITLDLSRVSGDSVKLRLDPPRGFWKIDYLGLAFDEAPASVVTEITASSAIDDRGEDVRALLAADDERYHVLEKVGDRTMLTFQTPPQAPGTVRSIFLKTSGWYRIHVPKDGPEQTAMLRELAATPGTADRYALDEYMNWREGWAAVRPEAQR